MEKIEGQEQGNVVDASVMTDAEQAPQTQSFSTAVTVATLAGVFCAVFTFALDSTIVAVIQSTLVDRFGEIQKLPWISVAYQLGSLSVNLLWGRIYHSFNHKWTFVTAVVLFEAGSAVCGAAPSMNAFIVGRIIAGLGGNGIYNGSLNILSNISSIEKRAVYISYFGVIWCLGVLIGPIIGGALASRSYDGWRWCFYLNLLIAAVSAPVYLFALPSFPQARGRTVMDRLRHLDYFGNILWIGASVSGVIALSFGGGLYSWSSGNIIGSLCVSAVLFCVFVAQQRYSVFVKPKDRAMPVHLLASRENCLFFAITAADHANVFIPVFYIPLYFEFIRHKSALDSGVHLMPYVGAAMFLVLLNGATMMKLRYYTPWFIIGSALGIVGAALMTTVSSGTASSTIYGFSVILAAGNAAYVQAALPIVQAQDPSESSNAVALLICGQRIGITSGFAIAYTIFLNRAATLIGRQLPLSRAEVQAAVAAGNAEIFNTLPPTEKQAVLDSVSTAIDEVYYQVLAGTVFCFILSLLLKHNNPLGPKAQPKTSKA